MAASCSPITPPSDQKRQRCLTVALASSEIEVAECQRLRYQVFAEELGARIDAHQPGRERDAFDAHCEHLLVRDESTGQVVATTRLMLEDGAAAAGGFYSETEFELGAIHGLDGNLMEVGRTCVNPAYRGGSTLAVLWTGIAHAVDVNQIDYLIGCASIPLANGSDYVAAVLERLRRDHSAGPELAVYPRAPLPPLPVPAAAPATLPTLLKGYLKQGAVVCGHPYWDEAFGVADVFVLLERDRIAKRYIRHFLHRE